MAPAPEPIPGRGRVLQSIPGYQHMFHDRNLNPYGKAELPIEKLDEIRLIDVESFLYYFEIYVNKAPFPPLPAAETNSRAGRTS